MSGISTLTIDSPISEETAMTRIAKIVATTALILGTTATAVSPALADSHQPVSPDNAHATLVVPHNTHVTDSDS
ncbi:hypothetical protein BIV23_03605 [Streptomyces monashensis]|uniref:Uncharacterized protein n=2 Tax=Streptomyces monashensis TaxID=1678012 RepID=A0A1S2QNH2_9ACTN|nr:hypothetical protein BIV23_03605 [Streptomyces monashensis]